MAVNFPNFLNAQIQEPWYGNAVESLAKGFQAGVMPAQTKQSMEQARLANALKQLELEHKPTEYSLSDALKQAQAQAALQKASMNPLELAAAKERQKMDLKRQQEILQLARHLRETGQDVAGIEGLFEGGKSPTGPMAYLAQKTGKGSKELGEFNERALRLQADLARMISQRGGAVAAGLAATGKPSAWSDRAYNLGITKAMRERIQREFNNLQKEYQEITGEKLPYDLEDVFHSATQSAANNYEGSSSPQAVAAPKQPAWVTDKKRFKQWLKSLTPEEQQAVRAQHLGGG